MWCLQYFKSQNKIVLEDISTWAQYGINPRAGFLRVGVIAVHREIQRLWSAELSVLRHLDRQGGLAPQGVVYDRRNNVMWGWDPVLKQVKMQSRRLERRREGSVEVLLKLVGESDGDDGDY